MKMFLKRKTKFITFMLIIFVKNVFILKNTYIYKIYSISIK